MRRLLGNLLLLASAALCISGCQDETSGVIPVSGIDTLSSDIQWSGSSMMIPAFDFSEARIRYAEISTAETMLDLALDVQSSGNLPYGAMFTLYGNRPFIQDMGIVSLEEITEAPETGYVSLLLNIGVSHSYCILTADGRYARIHLNDVDWDTRPFGTPYAWIQFEWQFQPDGGRVF